MVLECRITLLLLFDRQVFLVLSRGGAFSNRRFVLSASRETNIHGFESTFSSRGVIPQYDWSVNHEQQN
jgi:hypothetical protein